MQEPRAAMAAVRVVACVAAFCVATGLGGCATQLADAPLIGLPANAPARPAEPAAYMPIHDTPPPREEVVPTTDEQAQLQRQLVTARDKQNAKAKALAKQSGN